jgi:hypothetical protein
VETEEDFIGRGTNWKTMPSTCRCYQRQEGGGAGGGRGGRSLSGLGEGEG